MYNHRRFRIRVRDGRGRYGEHAPTPAEEHPGATVLQDLPTAVGEDIPAILARYAALRAWSLRQTASSPAAVADHALSAAHDHLQATQPDWAEASLLQRALNEDGAASLRLLERAADCAEAAGHRHGARALREAVHRARWRAARYPPPSAS